MVAGLPKSKLCNSKGCFPVIRVFLRTYIRTECSEHVNSFLDSYGAHVRKRTPKKRVTGKQL